MTIIKKGFVKLKNKVCFISGRTFGPFLAISYEKREKKEVSNGSIEPSLQHQLITNKTQLAILELQRQRKKLITPQNKQPHAAHPRIPKAKHRQNHTQHRPNLMVSPCLVSLSLQLLLLLELGDFGVSGRRISNPMP